MPADSGRGRIVLPVAGGGRGRGRGYTVAGAGLWFVYPRGFYPLPFLLLRIREFFKKICIEQILPLHDFIYAVQLIVKVEFFLSF